MAVKAIIDRLRMLGGYSGCAVYAGERMLFSENVADEYAGQVLRLLRTSTGVRRVSVAARGFTFTGFGVEDYDILLKLAGRFPPVPSLSLAEPEFVDPFSASGLPSRERARAEAEAALRALGLLDGQGGGGRVP
ncbi:MAG: hypothetical protein A4E28_03034 [Methanocella sp. PtaU1.Bin125]|nr:MAG: hypothetical protein A4E28_03034 [Methanocella sp. PtaU1.Bin125]